MDENVFHLGKGNSMYQYMLGSMDCTELPEHAQQVAVTMTEGLGSLCYGGRLRKLGLVSLQKTQGETGEN